MKRIASQTSIRLLVSWHFAIFCIAAGGFSTLARCSEPSERENEAGDGRQAASNDPALPDIKARALREEVIMKLLGQDLPGAITCQRELINVLELASPELKWRRESEQVLLLELEGLTQRAASEQATYLAAMKNYVRGHKEMALKDFSAAEKSMEKASIGLRFVVGDKSISLASALSKRGAVALEQGESESAKTYYHDALAAMEGLVSEDNPDNYAAISVIAYACLQNSEFAEAEQHLQVARKMALSHYGRNNKRYAELLIMLADAKLGQSGYEKAETLCLEALATEKQGVDLGSGRKAACYWTLGEAQAGKNDPDEAVLSLRKAMTYFERIYPAYSSELAEQRDQQASLLRKLGRHEEAKAVEAAAETIRMVNQVDRADQ